MTKQSFEERFAGIKERAEQLPKIGVDIPWEGKETADLLAYARGDTPWLIAQLEQAKTDFKELSGVLQVGAADANCLEKENSELNAHYTQAPNAYADSFFELKVNGNNKQKLRTVRTFMKAYRNWRDQSPSQSLGEEIEELCRQMDELEAQIERHRAVVVAARAFPPKTVYRLSPLGDYVTCGYCYCNDETGIGILESHHSKWKAMGHHSTCPITLRAATLDALDAKDKS